MGGLRLLVEGAPLKNFSFLILVFVLMLFVSSPAIHAGDDTSKQHELDRIKREMHEKKKKIKQADRKERSILSALDKLDRDIAAGTAELADQQKRLREAEDALREVEQKNNEIARELVSLKRSYGERLRALYKMSRSNYAVAVLAAEGPGGPIKRVKYLSTVAERDRTVMREYGSALSRLATRQAEIAEIKEDILGRKRSVEVKRAELEVQRQKKAGILSGVRQEKGLYEQTLRELEESSVALWTMIKKDEQERKAAKVVVPPARGAVRGPASSQNRLSWPVDGQVLTRFGMQRHPQFGTMVFRRGIEIAARDGESVQAVESGEVAYADWYKGYGKLLIIDHGNGFYTLYGNLSRLSLNKGERVVKGQVIGLAGDTGSSKGAKLYFEIRRNGEAQDPLGWLAKR
jgi:septal ring factor EnvC (AmiA/AmiB activator)